MLYNPKIDDYLKFLTGEEVKDYLAISFSEYLKSIREEQNRSKKAAKLIFVFLTSPDEVEKYVHISFSDNCIFHYNVQILNIFDLELQLISTKLMIKNNLKEMIDKTKNFKVKTKLVLEYKTRNDRKIFHSSAKLTDSDSDIDEEFKSLHESVMTKIINFVCEDWIALDIIIKDIIRFLIVSIR